MTGDEKRKIVERDYSEQERGLLMAISAKINRIYGVADGGFDTSKRSDALRRALALETLNESAGAYTLQGILHDLDVLGAAVSTLRMGYDAGSPPPRKYRRGRGKQ